jgi:hypothetical protein
MLKYGHFYQKWQSTGESAEFIIFDYIFASIFNAFVDFIQKLQNLKYPANVKNSLNWQISVYYLRL